MEITWDYNKYQLQLELLIVKSTTLALTLLTGILFLLVKFYHKTMKF